MVHAVTIHIYGYNINEKLQFVGNRINRERLDRLG